MANVTVIPASKSIHTRIPSDVLIRRKVAGYARVSTDSEEQLTSYEAQVDYYTRYIRSKSDWQYVEVYTDEGISATSTKKRDGFNRMIADALAGKIDLIITKSVSRFARNTVDSLTAVRKLKEHGCEVYFEKENIWTFDSKGELLITIMSSLAQEESRSISENVTWGQRKRFADGKVSLPYKSFLGYKKGEDGLPEIVPEQAEIVRRIYRLFIAGKSVNYIAATLTREGIPTPRGRSKWQTTTVESILTNEKYKGSAVLQKKFTVDFLSKKIKVNEGEVPQYYVENSHPAIIDPSEWDLVQAEMAKRKARGRHHNSLSPFSSKIICGDCGGQFGSKVWHSTDKYRRVIWQCNGKYKGEEKCHTPHLYEEDIIRLFLEALGDLLNDRSTLLDDCEVMYTTLADTTGIDSQCEMLSAELDAIALRTERLMSENASVAMDQAEYIRRYDDLSARFADIQQKQNSLQALRSSRIFEAEIIECFMTTLRTQQGLPIDFDPDLWNALVDHVTVYHDEHLVFTFKNGIEIEKCL